MDSVQNDFDDRKKEIQEYMKLLDALEQSGGEFSSFVDSFIKNPEDVKIEGFINDSDVYEFYLKWRNDIDEILNDIKFFGETPTEINAFGLYEYVIKGTENSMNEIVKMLS